jgi:hypothetical protein
MTKYNDLSQLKKVLDEYKKMSDNERTLRRELRGVAEKLKQAELERDKIDTGVSEGVKYASALKAQNEKIDAIRAERNALSDRIEKATAEREAYHAKTMLPCTNVLLEAYDAIIKIDNELAGAVNNLNTVVKLIDGADVKLVGGVGLAVRTPLGSSGLESVLQQDYRGGAVVSSVITERDRVLIHELKTKQRELK